MQSTAPEHWECTNDEYHASPGVSRSMLREIANPLLYYQRYVAKTEPRKKPTAAMEFGTRAHDIVLSPGGMDAAANVLIIPEDVLTKAGAKSGSKYYAWRDEHAGKVLLKADKLRAFERIIAGIEAHDKAIDILLRATEHEYAIRWTDAETGLLLRTKLDLIHPRFVVDYKTAADVTPRGFARAIADDGYDYQAAFYSLGFEVMFGERMPFVFITSKNEPPYNCETFDLDEQFIVRGEAMVRRDLRRLAECRASDKWQTSTCGQIITLSPPAWAVTESQYDVEDIE